MRVAMMVDNPQGTREIYDQVRKHVGLDRPAGGVLYVAGPSPNGGWRVIEVFDSQDAAKRFVQEHLAPASRPSGHRRLPHPNSGPCTTT